VAFAYILRPCAATATASRRGIKGVTIWQTRTHVYAHTRAESSPSPDNIERIIYADGIKFKYFIRELISRVRGCNLFTRILSTSVAHTSPCHDNMSARARDKRDRVLRGGGISTLARNPSDRVADELVRLPAEAGEGRYIAAFRIARPCTKRTP